MAAEDILDYGSGDNTITEVFNPTSQNVNTMPWDYCYAHNSWADKGRTRQDCIYA